MAAATPARSRTSLRKAERTTSASPITRRAAAPGHFYRIKVGQFPLADAAFPLGLQKGKTAAYYVSPATIWAQTKFDVKGEPSPKTMRAVIFRPTAPTGPAFNRVKLALGQ